MPTTRNTMTMADPEALAIEAARRIVARLQVSPRPALCLTGGSGALRLYELLGDEPFRSRIAWDRVHWFIGDERFVPAHDPLNNMSVAKRIFLDRCAPSALVHAIPTDAVNPDEAALLYQDRLRQFYGAQQLDPAKPLFDVVLMGVGPDGHTASLFPGASSLSERERWVVGVETANVAPFVPRVTLTLPALASCSEMLFLVNGAGKRDILSRIEAGEDLPAARAQSANITTWLVDSAALDKPHAN
jgi:6-phosphogluconolactonase